MLYALTALVNRFVACRVYASIIKHFAGITTESSQKQIIYYINAPSKITFGGPYARTKIIRIWCDFVPDNWIGQIKRQPINNHDEQFQLTIHIFKKYFPQLLLNKLHVDMSYLKVLWICGYVGDRVIFTLFVRFKHHLLIELRFT